MTNEFKMVPVEPTEEMMRAGMDVSNTRTKWQAMLAAAPTPPQPIYDEAKERELFEAAAVNSAEEQGLEADDMLRSGDGDYLNPNIQLAFWGWLACAQSRAKAGEVGHE